MVQTISPTVLVATKRRKKIDNIQNLLITIWPLVGFMLFGFIPMVVSLYMSLTDAFDTDLANAVFVGFKNFEYVLQWEGHVWYAYANTLIFLASVPVTIFVSLFIANLVNNARFGKRFFRSVLFIPYICSTVVVAFSFRMLYSEAGGILNSLLGGMGFAPVQWLSKSPVMFMASVDLMAIWSGSGSCVVLLSAALSRVDESYYEAAEIDGITSFKKFWKITFPAITPTLSYLVTMNVIGGLQVMAEPMILAGEVDSANFPAWTTITGEITSAKHTIVYNIYHMCFENSYKYGFGMGSASAWVLAGIILIVTKINMKLQEKWVCYDF